MYHQAIIFSTNYNSLKELQSAFKSLLPKSFALEESNPDIKEIRRVKSSIGIAEIQPLIAWNMQKPYQGENKLGIIYEADRLTPEAQNSLLKTLEEPAPGTLLCLVTHNRAALLPTILSRSQVVALNDAAIVNAINSAEGFITADMLEKSQIIAKVADNEDNREAAITFVSELMHELVKHTDKFPPAVLNKYLDVCKQCFIGLKAGANIKLTLETIVISMS